MRRKIPSTAALVVFEAAARHESFSRTAEELCLTESAISRQITALEQYLGLKLFNRIKNRLTLSEAGRVYCEQVRTILDQLEWNTVSLKAHQGLGGSLELAVIPTFTLRWLIPRLRGFYAAYPDIRINMREKPEPFLFRNSNFDAAVHFDHPAWAGVVKIDLFTEELIPVLSPRHYDVKKLRDPADLRDIPLLHKGTSTRTEAWKSWFERVGCRDANPMKGTHYELYSMLIEAAVAGLGAALVPKFYVAGEIAVGDLAAPFAQGLENEKRFCLVYPEYKQDCQPLKLFIEWLVEAARQFCAERERARRPRPVPSLAGLMLQGSRSL